MTPTTDATMTTETLSNWLPREKLRGFATKEATSYPSGRMWPHGEWSLGWAKRRPDGGEWHENPYVGLGVDDVGMAERAGQSPVPLNLSDAPNSTSAPRRGAKGITGYGQQMVKAAGFLMGERWPRHRKTLGTVTLPPMEREQRQAVVAAWPDLTRELLRWVTRKLERQGLPPIVCSVTEVQPSRLQETGQGYLHWHLLWLNRPGDAGDWAIEPNDLRTWLNDLVYRLIPGYQGGHINVNTKRVEGEAARYMAKYMSKGKQQVSEAMEDWGEDNCPRTWWNMSKPARDMVKRETHEGETAGALLESILEQAWQVGPDVLYEFLRHIELEWEGRSITVGWRGRFTQALAMDVRDLLKSGDIAGL